MTSKRVALLSLFAAGVTSFAAPPPRLAGACSLAGNEPHTLDTAAHGSDTTPPTAVTAARTVNRYFADDAGGCGGGQVATCGDYGLITLTLSGATDDATPAAELGYRITITDGTPPPGFRGVDEDVRGPEVYIYFDVDDPNPVEFTLEIRAVDLNGNLGPATEILISDARD